jgi:hypothetical protein
MQLPAAFRPARETELLAALTAAEPNLMALVEVATELYPPLLTAQIDVDFATAESGDGPDDGGGEGDGGGAEGDAGDGAEGSPIPSALCDFALSLEGEALGNTVLSDLFDNGRLDRPDLQPVAGQVNIQNPDALSAAFRTLFPGGIGRPLVTTAADALSPTPGRYHLPLPPGVPGFVRCVPPVLLQLRLVTFVPARQPGETLVGQDVTPQTTVFSTKVATSLQDNLAATKQNFENDIVGLRVASIEANGSITGFQAVEPTNIVDKEVGLVAFSATALFNIFFQNGINVDYLAALDAFLTNKEVVPADLERLGVPPTQTQELAGIVNGSVTTAEEDLNTDLAVASTTSRIIVRVTGTPGGVGIPGAMVDITDDESVVQCELCPGITDAAGEVLLTVTGVPETDAIALTVGASVAGFETANTPIEVVAFATVDAEIVLTPGFRLAVTQAGDGSGTVTADPPGIACGQDCTETYPQGTQVTLTATPATGSTFTGWSGEGCSGTSTCTVSMTQARNVIATFTLQPPPPMLTVSKAGTGSGTVTSSPAGINCGSACSAPFASGTSVTLTATAAAGSTFTGWSGGGCSGTGPCTVNMDQNRAVTATFTGSPPEPIADFTLQVTPAGDGSGTVTAGGISCGTDCTETYPSGTPVTLTAAPAPGSSFTGWSGGGCSGTGPCIVTMNQNRTVNATFRVTFTLQVALEGDGSGTVIANTGDINCGTDCIFHYFRGVIVVLTARPAPGSVFTGWSGGGCSGTGTCGFVSDQNRFVTATFNAREPEPPLILNIRKSSEVTPSNNCRDSDGNTFIGNEFSVSFDYDDRNGDVIEGVATVHFDSFNATRFSSFSGGSNGFIGTITSRLCRSGSIGDVTMTLTDASGRTSNPLTINIPTPDGTN